jgi:O-antigen ligase
MAERLGRLLTLVCLTPVLLHLVGRHFEGAWLVLLLLALPALASGIAATRGYGARDRDEFAWLVALASAFVTPLLPLLFRIEGYEAALVPGLGALAWLAWHGRLTALTAAPRWGRLGRLFFVVSAAWAIGSAVRGYFAYAPVGAPWEAELFGALLLDPLGYRSLIDPVRPFAQLFLRLEMLAFAWGGFELALGALGRGDGVRFEARLLRSLVWAVGLGLLVAVSEFIAESVWRGDPSVLAAAAAGIARNHRPLGDHNALGSAIVLIAPLLFMGALARREEGHLRSRLAAALAALVCVGLLVTSRSKSALAGFGVALPLAAGLWAISHRGRARRLALALGAAAVLFVVGFNLAPDALIERIAETRYGSDLVRVARLDAAMDYLEDNRAAVWRSARAVGAEHPLVGVGLGRLPLLLGEHHDPHAGGWFNPRNENAHSQYLQWYAEEGWVGVLLGVMMLAGAILGGLRRQSRLSLAGSAAICGLALNLVVGHALLVSSVALLFAGIVGWLFAGGAMTRVPDEAAESAGRRPYLAPAAAGLAFALALLPLALPGGRRPLPLAEATLGCYPWDWSPGDGPKRARAMAPEARWFQVWKQGDVMKIPVADVRDPLFQPSFRLNLSVNGKMVLEDWPLPHRTRAELAAKPSLAPNPQAYFRIERPAGVVDGDLVELHLESNSYIVGTDMFQPDGRRVALRMWPAFFK